MGHCIGSSTRGRYAILMSVQWVSKQQKTAKASRMEYFQDRTYSAGELQIERVRYLASYEVWFGFLECIGGGVEVSESVCAVQFVTFDSLFLQYAFWNWWYNTWVGWVSRVGILLWCVQGIQIKLRKYLTRSICNSYSLASPEECKLMRFEIGKQIGKIWRYCTFVPPFCYWWLIMTKRGWKLYRSPNVTITLGGYESAIAPKILGDVYLLLYHRYHYNSNF